MLTIVPPQDERDLIAEAQRGSAAAFEELLRLHDAVVLKLALRMTRSEEEARDIYQEGFLKAYRSIREFKGECGFRTWLLRIVTNLCLDRARRRAGPPRREAASRSWCTSSASAARPGSRRS